MEERKRPCRRVKDTVGGLRTVEEGKRPCRRVRGGLKTVEDGKRPV